LVSIESTYLTKKDIEDWAKLGQLTSILRGWHATDAAAQLEGKLVGIMVRAYLHSISKGYARNEVIFK